MAPDPIRSEPPASPPSSRWEMSGRARLAVPEIISWAVLRSTTFRLQMQMLQMLMNLIIFNYSHYLGHYDYICHHCHTLKIYCSCM